MSRDYPRYAGKIKLNFKEKKRTVKCVCGQPACGRADVQYSWSRSDDRTYPVCEEHRQLASRNLLAFLAIVHAQQHLPVTSEKS